jgi:hypothetical protein
MIEGNPELGNNLNETLGVVAYFKDDGKTEITQQMLKDVYGPDAPSQARALNALNDLVHFSQTPPVSFVGMTAGARHLELTKNEAYVGAGGLAVGVTLFALAMRSLGKRAVRAAQGNTQAAVKYMLGTREATVQEIAGQLEAGLTASGATMPPNVATAIQALKNPIVGTPKVKPGKVSMDKTIVKGTEKFTLSDVKFGSTLGVSSSMATVKRTGGDITKQFVCSVDGKATLFEFPLPADGDSVKISLPTLTAGKYKVSLYPGGDPSRFWKITVKVGKKVVNVENSKITRVPTATSNGQLTLRADAAGKVLVKVKHPGGAVIEKGYSVAGGKNLLDFVVPLSGPKKGVEDVGTYRVEILEADSAGNFFSVDDTLTFDIA